MLPSQKTLIIITTKMSIKKGVEIVSFMETIVLFLIIYTCVYMLVSRICACIQCCAAYKAFSKYIETQETEEEDEDGSKRLSESSVEDC